MDVQEPLGTWDHRAWAVPGVVGSCISCGASGPWVHAATLAWRLMTIIVEILGLRGLPSLRLFDLRKQKG